MKTKVLFDMETGDPDDVLTLALLATHPKADLLGVTITPGTPDQVGIVRHVLDAVGRGDLPVGAFNLDHGKSCVSEWHYKTFGKVPPSRNALKGWETLCDLWDEDVTLITGGPLKNVGALLHQFQAAWNNGIKNHLWRFDVGNIVVQGGFAGDGVVPFEMQLPKFHGRTTCPTYNLNGDPTSAKSVLAFEELRGKRHFVSKNVCHGVVYDREMHDIVCAVPCPHPGLALIKRSMDAYVAGDGAKALHDPLAAMCALYPEIGVWAEVEIYRERGEWGSKLSPGSGTWILIGYDRKRFLEAFCEV